MHLLAEIRRLRYVLVQVFEGEGSIRAVEKLDFRFFRQIRHAPPQYLAQPTFGLYLTNPSPLDIFHNQVNFCFLNFTPVFVPVL